MLYHTGGHFVILIVHCFLLNHESLLRAVASYHFFVFVDCALFTVSREDNEQGRDA